MADPAVKTDPEPEIDPSPLSSLVGPDKKFKDAEALAAGKIAADKFVTKLETENAELRAQLAAEAAEKEEWKRKADFTSNLQNSNDPSSRDGNQTDPQRKQSVTSTATGLTEDDVFRLVETREATKVAEKNLKDVNATLVKEFGATAKAVIVEKAEALGLPVEYLMQTAKTSPTAFYNLIGLQPSNSRNTSLTSRASGVNSSALNKSTPNSTVRNRAYYQKVKTEMGATKFALDTNLQVQMHKDIVELGDLWD